MCQGPGVIHSTHSRSCGVPTAAMATSSRDGARKAHGTCSRGGTGTASAHRRRRCSYDSLCQRGNHSDGDPPGRTSTLASSAFVWCGVHAARPLHYSHRAITSLLSDTIWDRSQAFEHVPAAACAKRHCNYVMTLHTSAAAEVGGKGHVS